MVEQASSLLTGRMPIPHFIFGGQIIFGGQSPPTQLGYLRDSLI
jgi:hypothetical protein